MKRALVVEDDPDIVELIVHYLTAEGFEVEALGDGRQALERLREGGHRPRAPRPAAARPGRPQPLRRAAARASAPARCPSSCSPRAATRPTASWASRWAPTTTWSSPSAPRSSWLGSAPSCAASSRREDEEAPLVLGPLEIDGERHVVRWEGAGRAPHGQGVRAPRRPRRGPRAESSRARCCSSTSGDTPTRRGREPWTCTSGGCARSCPGIAAASSPSNRSGYRMDPGGLSSENEAVAARTHGR